MTKHTALPDWPSSDDIIFDQLRAREDLLAQIPWWDLGFRRRARRDLSSWRRMFNPDGLRHRRAEYAEWLKGVAKDAK